MSGQALPQPTGTAARPSGPSNTLHTSWAGSLMGSALEGLRLHARKSSPCALTTPQIRRFCACWASFFAEMPLEERCWAKFFAPTGATAGLSVPLAFSRPVAGGGFALHEAFSRRVAGVSNPRAVQFPPIGDGELAVCGGVAATVQTHWAKRAQNRRLRLNGTARWRIRCLAWCAGRT